MHHPRRPPRLLVAASALLLLTLVGCFEQPVSERLILRFLPNGAAIVTALVEVRSPAEGESNPALDRRLAETRQSLLEGWDAWTGRFAALDPAAERFSWEKRLGELTVARRDAAVVEPERLGGFFADTPVGVSYTMRDGVADLAMTAGPPSRATRKQKKDVERALGTWSEAIVGYLTAGGDLYAYLEERPERARACFGRVFEELLSDEDRASLDELSEEEHGRVEPLRDAMKEVWDVLLVEERADHSLDELSRLVYDPFPARVTVILPGDPLDGEGFEPTQEGDLAVPTRGFWTALSGLEGRWLSPDPALLYVAVSSAGDDRKVDLSGLAREERQAAETMPNAAEVRAAIEERLAPVPLYRLTWRVDPAAAEADEDSFTWPE